MAFHPPQQPPSALVHCCCLLVCFQKWSPVSIQGHVLCFSTGPIDKKGHCSSNFVLWFITFFSLYWIVPSAQSQVVISPTLFILFLPPIIPFFLPIIEKKLRIVCTHCVQLPFLFGTIDHFLPFGTVSSRKLQPELSLSSTVDPSEPLC